MINEMQSFIMDNHCTNNESNKNNKENTKEASTKAEEGEDKGKKYNAYSQLINFHNKSAAIDHFMDECSGTSPIWSVNISRRKTMLFKKGYHPMPKNLQQPCTQGLGGNC